MATLITYSTDHPGGARTTGTVARLTSLMVTAQVTAYPLNLTGPARVRACEAVVRAAIRRRGVTDAHQELVMDDTERAAWEADNPAPEW